MGLLKCGLDLDRRNNSVKISMPQKTLLPKSTILNIVRLALGREPPLICPGWFASNATGCIVGKRGKNLAGLEKLYMLRLSVRRESEWESKLVGWFSADYFEKCPSSIESCAEAGYIQREVEEMSEKVSEELFFLKDCL